MSWPADTSDHRAGLDASAPIRVAKIVVCSRDAMRARRGLLTLYQCSSEGPSRAANTKDVKNGDASASQLRYPRSVQSLYLRPLRRETKYGIPSCDLQLRSYSIRNLEFFCDFALRAAYYLDLPAFGPVPLPRITERWTVPKSNFIFKKSQENFERVTLRRLVQIRDGNPETVQVWLAFLQKHAYSGVGMKANMWEFSKLGQFQPQCPFTTLSFLSRRATWFTNAASRTTGMSQAMKDSEAKVAKELEESWAHLGQRRPVGSPQEIEERLRVGRSRTMGS